ncbi:MAG: hypothetical protein AAFW84_03640 [Cyanobacteria bacterium J06635_15]
MMTTSTSGVLALLMSKLARFQEEATEINAACAAKGLPPALDVSLDGDIRIEANKAYQFAGFGVVVGLPPKLSFYVHYKPDSPDHVSVGKFLVPIRFGEIDDILADL